MQRMKQVLITWEKSMSVNVYAPEDMRDEDIARIAKDISIYLDQDWQPPDWDTHLSSSRTVEVPDDECKIALNHGKYGVLRTPQGRFNDTDVVVVSDDRLDFVNPSDASWWVGPSTADSTESSLPLGLMKPPQ